MCALVTWVTEHVLLMLTMQLNAQVFMMQINLIDCDILSAILFQVTTPKVSRVKDDPESPDMFGLDQV